MSALRIRVFTLAGMAVQLRRNTQVDTNSAIKLELGYLGGMIQREFIFKGNSSSGGPVTLNSCSGDLDTMPALVVGKQGNK